MNELDYRIAGDRGILIKFGPEINEAVYNRILQFEMSLGKSNLQGIIETVRGFCTLSIFYDPSKIDYKTLEFNLKKIEEKALSGKIFRQASKVFEIPAIYGDEYGPDLPLVAELLNISEEEVIQRHLSDVYLVYITGHIGGSAFFKGNDKIFDLPRKKTPVISYPAGSLLFADGLGTVFKALDGPTGWYNIGRSPLRQWYPHKDPPVLFKSGDRIRYRRINTDEFDMIKHKVDQNKYELKYV